MLVSEKMIELGEKLEESRKVPQENGENASASLEQTAGQILPGSASLRTKGKKSIGELLKGLQNLQLVENTPRHHWRLAALRAAQPDELDRETIKALDKWRFLEILWISFLLVTGVVVTYTLFQLDLNWKSPEVIGFLIGIWGVVITSIIASVKKLVEKKEALLLRTTNLQNIEKNQVSFADRKQVDQMVRQQCLNEIHRVFETLFETRGVIYRFGKTELAGMIKEFEQEVEDWKAKIQNPAFATPYYLSVPSVNQSDWTKLLDQEEEVLGLSKGLGKAVEAFRLTGADAGPEDLEKIKQHLYALENNFFDRSRLN
ncbi:MAG: hypothetical protein AB9891_12925 [Anaerolineaceae bacterium]